MGKKRIRVFLSINIKRRREKVNRERRQRIQVFHFHQYKTKRKKISKWEKKKKKTSTNSLQPKWEEKKSGKDPIYTSLKVLGDILILSLIQYFKSLPRIAGHRRKRKRESKRDRATDNDI